MAVKFLIWRVAALLAFALSATSLAESWRGEPLFCPLSGCEAVARSAYGKLLGVPLPYLGLVGFGTFYVLALFPSAGMNRLLGPVALLAGFAGLALVAIQALALGQFCQLCLYIDAAAMLLALTELIWNAPEDDGKQPMRTAWLAALGLGLVGPLAVSQWVYPEPATPEEVLALQRPGVLTIVFVTDFECQHCRETHPAVRRLVEEDKTLRLVLKVFPLPAHEHSRDAARAYFAAEQMGKGPSMAEALLAAEDLSPAGCAKVAERLGLDEKRFAQLVGSPEVEALLEETAWMKTARVPGLPGIWVGTRRLSGYQSEESLRAAIEQERERLKDGGE